jgi:hypothetical protein
MRSIVVFCLFVAGKAAAFSPSSHSVYQCASDIVALNLQSNGGVESSRRDMIGKVAGTAFGISTAGVFFAPSNALASGGATAGGAYLLSAKQRYNSRVTAGIKAFLALSAPLEGGSIAEAKAFLANDEEGGWGDLKAAGYLLSNAFRTSSTKPPDSLPSVQAWKAFQSEVDKMQKAADKKSKSGVADAYKKAEAALDTYLERVELPPVIEMRQ